MRPFDQQRRLFLAFTISLLIHTLLLGAEGFKRFLSGPPQLPTIVLVQARLLQPRASDPLLKNTLNARQASAVRELAAARAGSGAAPAARERVVRERLAEHLFYPPEAVARGLEGEVRLLLTLDPLGRILETQIASSSGHGVLDQAAVDAAHAAEPIPAAGARELILPVVFKLR